MGKQDHATKQINHSREVDRSTRMSNMTEPDSPIPRLPPDANHRRTMDALIDSAITVFGRDGFRSARMGDIADHAGRSRTTLYTYFRGRNDLVLAIRHRLHPETHALFVRVAELVEPTHDQVRQWVDDFADIFDRRRVEWSISMEALSEPALHDILQTQMQAAVTVVIDAIGQARPDGRRPRRARVEILFSQLLYTMHLVIIRDVFSDRDEVMDELARVWFEELRGS